ncbi:MAG: hypothetical protein V1831_02145 [Candidatus Woesearchaeota archaeon]
MDFVIHGKKVKIVYNFDEYSERKYKNDFEELVTYQTKKEIIDKEKNPRALDLKFLNIKGFKYIPYDYFQKTVINFLTRVICQILNEFPNIITSKEFEIQIKIARVKQREYYGAYDPDVSDVEHAYTEFSGLWLLNTLVMPWVHFKRIDYPILYNFLVHELHHHVDYINKAFIYEEKLEDKWKLKAKQISNYSLVFLLSTLLELRVEGFAEFAKKRNFPKFDIHTDMIYEFRKNLAKLITIRKKREAEDFFNKKLSTESYLTYYCGRLMCYFIALFLTKRTINKPVIGVNNKTFPLEELDKIMSKHKYFLIQGVPTDIFVKTCELVSTMGPIEFLNMYNNACDNLGISYRNRVLWWVLFVKLKKATTYIHEKERIKKLIKKGYKP